MLTTLLTLAVCNAEEQDFNSEIFAPTVTEQNFLESETGLKIIQTGVGEVKVLIFNHYLSVRERHTQHMK